MRDFKGLIVWQKAHRLTVAIYAVTASFPREERFGLTAQVRKSAGCVPTNIAEGCGRFGEREFARFVSIAAGSASETEYHLLLAHDLGYLAPEQHRSLDTDVNEVKKMLGAPCRKLKASA